MYLAIEGCIGSGKTTVSNLLSKKRDFKLILEEFEKNPFLNKFYLEPGKHDLETELAFMLIHYHQLKEVLNADTRQNFISDFFIEKDLLFAKNNLMGKEYDLFEYLFNELSFKTPTPDIVICLDGSDEFIIRRVLERNRGNEGAINAGYFKKLNQRYKEFFKSLKIPSILVNMEEVDFIKRPEQIDWLDGEIDKVMQMRF